MKPCPALAWSGTVRPLFGRIGAPLTPDVAEWVKDEAKARKRRDLNARLIAAFASRPEEIAARSPVSIWQDEPTPTGRMWHEEAGNFTPAAEVAEISDADRRFAFSAEGEFAALCREQTGRIVPDVELSEHFKAKAEILGMSHAICQKMLAAGFDGYRDTPFSLYRYHVHSGHVERLPNFRRNCFIPVIAQQIRAPMVSALESFLESHVFARMWTMTSGPRTALCDVRNACKRLSRKISTLNAQPFMQAAGVEICFRSIELGTPEFNSTGSCEGGEIERDESGQLFFHVHSHCVVIQKKGFIPPKKWAVLLENVGKFWVHWWKDGGETKSGSATSGRIIDAREVCKYVTKPGEMLKLSGAELVELQKQLSRLKLCQPSGRFAEEIKAREERDGRLVRKQTPDGPILAEVKNWNRRPRRTKEEKTFDAAEKLDAPEPSGDSLRVVSRLLPGVGPCGVTEPRVMVLAMNWNEAAVRADESVKQLIAWTADKFGRALAERIRVHTCTPTVLAKPQFDFVETLPPRRAVLSGAELAGFAR